MPPRRPHVIVIGAGAAGLSAARTLVDAPVMRLSPAAAAAAVGDVDDEALEAEQRRRKKGRGEILRGRRKNKLWAVTPSVAVLEARGRVGGRVATFEMGGGGGGAAALGAAPALAATVGGRAGADGAGESLGAAAARGVLRPGGAEGGGGGCARRLSASFADVGGASGGEGRGCEDAGGDTVAVGDYVQVAATGGAYAAAATGAAGDGKGGSGSGAGDVDGDLVAVGANINCVEADGAKVMLDRAEGNGSSAPPSSEGWLPKIHVDIGANVMHGCADKTQSVFHLAVEAKIRAPPVAGNSIYESTECARWFDRHGRPIGAEVVAEMQQLYLLIARCMAVGTKSGRGRGGDIVGRGDMMTHYLWAKEYVLENVTSRNKELTEIEDAVLEKIRIRGLAYCSRMSDMAAQQVFVLTEDAGDSTLASVMGFEKKVVKRKKKSSGRRREISPANSAAGRGGVVSDEEMSDGHGRISLPIQGAAKSGYHSSVRRRSGEPTGSGEVGDGLGGDMLRVENNRSTEGVGTSRRARSSQSCDKNGGFPKELRPNVIEKAAGVIQANVDRADGPVCCVASRKPILVPDRIVIDGYSPFLIHPLARGLDVRLNCVIKRIEYLWSPASSFEVDSVGRKSDDGYRVRVTDSLGGQYYADHVVVTLPIGVLRDREGAGSVKFAPEISESKSRALRGLGMGIHNKVILRFKPEDVFWPSTTPQINCMDPRFQFFNLHAYGKPGIILTHVFGGTEFAHSNYGGMSDKDVVHEVLDVLSAMFYGGDSSAGGGVKRISDCFEGGDRAVSTLDDVCILPSHILELCGEVVCEAAPADTGDSPQLPEHEAKLKPKSTPKSSSKLLRKARYQKKGGKGSGSSRVRSALASPARKPDVFPTPIDAHVTHWDVDPFSLGSYSYFTQEGTWEDIVEMSKPEPSASENPTLFFAGEHCDIAGWQCVHGAFESGAVSASVILEQVNKNVVTVCEEKRKKPAGKNVEAVDHRSVALDGVTSDGVNVKVPRAVRQCSTCKRSESASLKLRFFMKRPIVFCDTCYHKAYRKKKKNDRAELSVNDAKKKVKKEATKVIGSTFGRKPLSRPKKSSTPRLGSARAEAVSGKPQCGTSRRASDRSRNEVGQVDDESSSSRQSFAAPAPRSAEVTQVSPTKCALSSASGGDIKPGESSVTRSGKVRLVSSSAEDTAMHQSGRSSRSRAASKRVRVGGGDRGNATKRQKP